MERITMSLDDGLLAEFDGYIRRKGYENRSEAIRDLLRQRLEQDRMESDDARYGVGCLSYVYNHHQRELARRLTQSQHDHHDLMLSTLHVHLDHENCLEVVLVKGETASVRGFAEATIAETGVRHGHLHLIAADVVQGRHSHPHHDADGHSHVSDGEDGHHHDTHNHEHDHGHDQMPHLHVKPKT
ncbi:MAG: nickel-responsive transcriptional regulator NikR [Telmatospirillum sp.]|nr:nickel-responsive transcriptional regulator NikR [Telmatospirillum sp.]